MNFIIEFYKNNIYKYIYKIYMIKQSTTHNVYNITL